MLLDKYTKLVHFNTSPIEILWAEGDYLIRASRAEERGNRLLFPGGYPIVYNGDGETHQTHEFKTNTIALEKNLYHINGRVYSGELFENLYDSVWYKYYEGAYSFIHLETHQTQTQTLVCEDTPLLGMVIIDGIITDLVVAEVSFQYTTTFSQISYIQSNTTTYNGNPLWNSRGFLDGNNIVKHNVFGVLFPNPASVEAIPEGFRSYTISTRIYTHYTDEILGTVKYSRFKGSTPLSRFGLTESSFFVRSIDNSTPFWQQINSLGGNFKTYRSIPFFDIGDSELYACLDVIHTNFGGVVESSEGPDIFDVLDENVTPGSFQPLDPSIIEGGADDLISRVQNEMQRFFARNGQYEDVYVHFIPTANGVRENRGKITFFGGLSQTSAENVLTYIFNPLDQPPSITIAAISWEKQPYLAPVNWGAVFNSFDANSAPYSVELTIGGVDLNVSFSKELLIPTEVYDPQVHTNVEARHLLVKVSKFNVFTEEGNILTVSGDDFGFDSLTETCEMSSFETWQASRENAICGGDLSPKFEDLLTCYREFFSTYVGY